MTIAWIAGTSATQATAATKSVVLSVPAGIANGNLMIVSGVVASNSATYTPPSGWTLLWSVIKSSCNNSAWYRIAASEPGSYTWTWSASAIGAWACGSWSGVGATAVEQYSAVGASSLSGAVTTLSATPSQPDWMLGAWADERGSTTGTTWTPGAGMTARIATSVTGTASEASVSLCDTNGTVPAGTPVTYQSTPTSGSVSTVAGICGIIPPFTQPPAPPHAIVRQAVARSAVY
jgi:hypothetical protein